jgi:ribonuclease HI
MPPVAATESKPSIWTAPKKGRLKLNFKGWSKSKSKRKGIGGVYRDHMGKFVLGYAQQIGGATGCMADLVALKRGLELAMENGWRDISIEGDFKGAISAMAGGIGARFGQKKCRKQYYEIAAMLPQLGNPTMSHVLHKGNMVANCLAELGYKFGAAEQQLWRDTPPDEVLRHLEQDAMKMREEDDEQSFLVGTRVVARKSKPRNLNSGSPSSIWTTPKKGWLKLNFDGSSNCKSKLSSIGGVYRDYKGRFVLGYAQQIGTATSSVAELMALKHGLKLAVENGWRGISIEGDFEAVIDAISGRTKFRAKKDLEQYTEIVAILPLLGKTTVSHVLRKGNKVADCFAELGHEAASQRLWRHTPPNEVLGDLEKDAANVHSPRRLKYWHYPCRPFSLRFMLQSFQNCHAATRGAKKKHGGTRLRETRARGGSARGVA